MTRTAVTHRTFLGARELMHIFVGQERNFTNHAENIWRQCTKFFLVDDQVPGMCAPLLLKSLVHPNFSTVYITCSFSSIFFTISVFPIYFAITSLCILSCHTHKMSQEFHMWRS
jgi:hypothetical protein